MVSPHLHATCLQISPPSQIFFFNFFFLLLSSKSILLLLLLFLVLHSPIVLIFTQNYNTGDYGQCYADGQIDNKDSVHE